MCNIGMIKSLWVIGIIMALLLAFLLVLGTLPNVVKVLSFVCLMLAVYHLVFAFVSARVIYRYADHLTWIASVNIPRYFVCFSVLVFMHIAVFINLGHGNMFALTGGELLVNALLTRCIVELFSRKFKGGRSKINGRDLDCLRSLGVAMGFSVKSQLCQ